MLVRVEKSFLKNEDMRGRKRRTLKVLKLIGKASAIPLDHCKTHKKETRERGGQQKELNKPKAKSTTPGGDQQRGTEKKH